jgi:hypothetical protein
VIFGGEIGALGVVARVGRRIGARLKTLARSYLNQMKSETAGQKTRPTADIIPVNINIYLKKLKQIVNLGTN